MGQALRKIDIDDYTGYFPFFYYGQLSLNTPRAFFLNTVPSGYGYLLRRVVCKWPDVNTTVTQYNKSLFVEFFDQTAFCARQFAPIPLQLISTYCNNQIRNGAPTNPAVYPAGQPLSTAMLNFFYPYGETINVQITGQTGSNPEAIDIILQGYYIPEGTAKIHGGA
jgi:hypothetical protein